MEKRTILWTLCLTNGLLISWTSLKGLSSPAIYAKETEHWMTQSMGQDLINLGIVPFYVFTSSYLHRRSSYFPLLWAGTTMYFIYTFLIYSFDVHFNNLFIFYCLILCLNFYLLLDLVYAYRNASPTPKTSSVVRKITGGYFIFISLLFCFLWLSEILPASLESSIPASLELVGLFTNPVEVLDLSFILPGILLGGILLLKNRSLGFLLGPAILTFLLLMEFTIGMLTIILWQKGLETHPEVAGVLIAFAGLNVILLVLNVKKYRLAP